MLPDFVKAVYACGEAPNLETQGAEPAMNAGRQNDSF